jgi:hypothetical protein
MMLLEKGWGESNRSQSGAVQLWRKAVMLSRAEKKSRIKTGAKEGEIGITW